MALQKYVKTRVIYDLDEASPESVEDTVIICMPRFVWELSRTLVRGYGLRKVNYSAGYSQGGYTLPDDAQFDAIDASVSVFLSEDDMTCDLEAGLAAIAQAIADLEFPDVTVISDAIDRLDQTIQDFEIPEVTAVSEAIASLEQTQIQISACVTGCGQGGSYGAGTVEQPPSGTEVPPETFPPGFDTQEEYDDYKCQVANAIIKSLSVDVSWILGADVLAFVATSMAIAFITPVPFDDLLVLAGALVAYFAQGVLAAAATEIIDYLEANKDTLVCLLFGSSDVSEAKDGVLADLAAGLGVVAFNIARQFINYDALNALFDKDSLWTNNGATMGVDCGNCGDDGHYTLNGVQDTETGWTSVESSPGTWQVAVAFYAISWSDDGGNASLIEVEVQSLSNFDGIEDSTRAFRARDNMNTGSACSGWNVYCQNPTPVGLFCMKKIVLRSHTEFTVEFNFGADC